MPGMMDTVLNLGLNDKSVLGFIEQTGNERTGWDCYRRFIDMFGDVVMGPTTGLEHHDFEVEMTRAEEEVRREGRHRPDRRAAQGAVRHLQEGLPEEGEEALPAGSAGAARSRPSTRCSAPGTASAPIKYRQINKITGLLGTAVNVCTMVFGNMGDESGTGVAFTRDGATGADEADGRIPDQRPGRGRGGRHPHAEAPRRNAEGEEPDLEEGATTQLRKIMQKLEEHYKYPQDVEFTVEQGKLWMLQTRNAKRTGLAGVRWAVEMATGKDFYHRQGAEEDPDARRRRSPR